MQNVDDLSASDLLAGVREVTEFDSFILAKASLSQLVRGPSCSETVRTHAE